MEVGAEPSPRLGRAEAFLCFSELLAELNVLALICRSEQGKKAARGR